jgi:hypothetical protein
MEIRFTLDNHFDAALISRIKEKANGSATNLAARFLMRHWYEIEKREILPSERQHANATGADSGGVVSVEDALSGMEEEW